MVLNGLKIEESKVYFVESKRSRIFKFLKNKPTANILELYDAFPGIKHDLIKYYKWLFRVTHAPSLTNDKDHIEKLKKFVFIYDHKMVLSARLTREEEEIVKYFVELVKDK